MTVTEICQAVKCTGCGLCADVCPRGAIRLQPDSVLGHLHPTVDADKCVGCGLCRKKCPANRVQDYQKPRVCYAAWCENEEIREGSSSGGIAAGLYRMALQKGYWAVGTVLTPDFHVQMKLTDAEADLKAFRGSKYLQAECTGVYRQAREILHAGGKVLFIGTPCQCAAMRSAAEGVDSAALITAELICHGVPSWKIFSAYIQSIADHKNRRATKVAFRSQYGVELTIWDGERVFWKYTGREDAFLVGFQKGLLHREACYQCPYARPERASDLIIGDFWGIDPEVASQKPKNCKVSVVLVNSDKGAKLLATCPELYLEERDYSEALNGNANLNHPSAVHPQREAFIALSAQRGIPEAFRQTIDAPLRKKRMKTDLIRFTRWTAKRLLPAKLQKKIKNWK